MSTIEIVEVSMTRAEMATLIPQLRTQVATLTTERDEARAGFHEQAGNCARMTRERDEARAWGVARGMEEQASLDRESMVALARERDAEKSRADAAEAKLADLSAPLSGLSPGPGYTLLDMDIIEAARGKPYERLRETVRRADAAEAELAKAVAWLDRCQWARNTIDLNVGPLEVQLAESQAACESLREVLPRIIKAARDGWGHVPGGKKRRGDCEGCDAVLDAEAALASAPVKRQVKP